MDIGFEKIMTVCQVISCRLSKKSPGTGVEINKLTCTGYITVRLVLVNYPKTQCFRPQTGSTIMNQAFKTSTAGPAYSDKKTVRHDVCLLSPQNSCGHWNGSAHVFWRSQE